jgi:ABC-type transport system substrate-binding protein
VGTGPFVRVEEVLTQNSLWWQGTENLNFQTVTLYSSASAEDTRDNFEIDNVHFVYNDPTATTAASFHCDYELWNSRGTVMQYVGYNLQSGVFQDQGMRLAVSHGVDRVSIAESVYHNFADVAVLPVHPASSMYYEDLAQKYDYTSTQEVMEELLDTGSFYLPEDQKAALQSGQEETQETALGEAPEADTQDTEDTEDTQDTEDAEALGEPEEDLTDPEEEAEETEAATYNNITLIVRSGNLSRVTAAEQVAQDLEAVGFTVTVRELANDDFYSALSNGEYDLYYGEVTLKPDFDLRVLLQSDGDLCYGGLGNSSRLEELLEASMENSGNRYDLYAYIMDQGYLCPVLFVNNAVFTTRGVFSGLDPAPGNLFYDIANIRVDHD